MVENVCNQVHHHIDNSHPDHIGLNHGIVPHGDGIHRQLPHTVPHEDAFNNGCTAQKAADGQSQKGDDGQHGGLENAFPQGHASPNASGLGPQHIVLVQFLQHRGPHLPHILGGHGNCQGQGWQNGALHRGSLGNHRQQLPFDGKQLHQQQCHKKVWQTVAHKAENPQKIVRKPVMLYCRQNPQRNGDYHRSHNRQRRQQQCCRQLGHKGLKHILSGDIAHAHVPREKSL